MGSAFGKKQLQRFDQVGQARRARMIKTSSCDRSRCLEPF